MEIRIGALSNYTPARLADRTASQIVGLTAPHAVCIERRGIVADTSHRRADAKLRRTA